MSTPNDYTNPIQFAPENKDNPKKNMSQLATESVVNRSRTYSLFTASAEY